jgi:ferredoxin-thioredoxin reductase catalytic chain
MTSANTDKTDSNKVLDAMKHFSEQYAKRTGTYFCSDLSVTAVVIEGLAKHKEELGSPLCPCRHYEDKEAEVKNTYWNCPCVPMRERKECHCMLFITPDNEFAGDKQDIDLDYILEVREKMGH